MLKLDLLKIAMTKNSYYFIMLMIVLYCGAIQSCKPKSIKLKAETNVSDSFPRPGLIIGYMQLDNDSITGDFDGNKKPDTISTYFYSSVLQHEIDSVPDFEDYYEIQPWLNERDVKLYITSRNKKDTFKIARLALGLYTFSNIGDINNDGKDELALVVDYADWSNMNSCRIYTKCNESWKEIHSFYIHELFYAYDSLNPIAFPLDFIPGHLEKIKGKWHYMDYLENDQLEDTTLYNKLNPLNITKKCE